MLVDDLCEEFGIDRRVAKVREAFARARRLEEENKQLRIDLAFYQRERDERIAAGQPTATAERGDGAKGER